MRTRGISAVVLLAAMFSLPTCAGTQASPPDVAGQTWDYVILGNSIGTWWAPDYGAIIKSDLSVKIEYHDFYVCCQTAAALLKEVKGASKVREAVENAEVITIGVGFADLRNAIAFWGAESPEPDSEIMDKALTKFEETFDAVLAEVVALAPPTAIIRTMDVYFPYVRRFKDRGIYEGTKRDWQRFNEAIAATAQRYGIPVARVYEAFNGPFGDDDPADKGYLDSDGQHPSEEGKKVIAELFRSLGYERNK